MTRPTEIKHGAYVATLVEERESSRGAEFTWAIHRDGVRVGKMFQGGAYDHPWCSMSILVWDGPLPSDCIDTKSPNYGIHFDTGPCDTHEEALATFAKRADRLIEWRKANA